MDFTTKLLVILLGATLFYKVWSTGAQFGLGLVDNHVPNADLTMWFLWPIAVAMLVPVGSIILIGNWSRFYRDLSRLSNPDNFEKKSLAYRLGYKFGRDVDWACDDNV